MAYINEFVIRFKHVVSPSAMSLIIYYIVWSVFSKKNQSKTFFCQLCLMPLSIALHINTNFNTQAGTEQDLFQDYQ
jgi:hypothetical protein